VEIYDYSETILVTPTLLTYLGCEDITNTVTGLKGGIEKIFLYSRLLIYFEPITKKQHASIQKKYPVYSYFSLDASLLSLRTLVETMLEEERTVGYSEGWREGYQDGDNEARVYYDEKREND